MMHPATEPRWVNDVIGLGVYAKEFIPKGTIVYILDPLEVLVGRNSILLQHPQLAAVIERYSYTDHLGRRVLSWDHAKYVNHSCDPNTMSTGYGFEIALRDIEAGEQVTDEYGLFNLTISMICACKSENCRHQILPSDIKTYSKDWDKKAKEALKYVNSVEQPLQPLLNSKIKSQLDQYLSTGKKYKSVRYLTDKKQDSTEVDYEESNDSIQSMAESG